METEEHHETLEAIADGIREELKKRYPLLEVIKYKLAAPGYSLGTTDLYVPNPREFSVKVTAIGVLVDIDRGPSPERYHHRIGEFDYFDPCLLEKVFAITDTFVVNGRLVPW